MKYSIGPQYEKVKVIMNDCMIEAFDEFELEVPFKVKIKIQNTWSKNENG